MAERIQKNLEPELQICHCQDAFKQLSCQHMFCTLPCPEKFFALDGYFSICPTCRKSIPLSGRDVANLQLLMHIDHLKETKQALTESQQNKCDNCGENIITYYCQECQKKFMCDQCYKTHKISVITRFHKIKSITEFRNEAENITAANQTIPTCQTHGGAELTFYCDACKELICKNCADDQEDQHKDHTYSQVADVFPRHKEKLISSLKPKQETINETLKAIDNLEKHIQDQSEDIKSHIFKEIEEQIELLKKRKIELEDELDKLTKLRLNTLAAKKKRVESINEKLTSYLEYTEEAITNPGMQCEVLEIKDPVLERIEYISTELDQGSLLSKGDSITLILNYKEQLKAIYKSYLKLSTPIIPEVSIDKKEPCKVINKLKKPWGVAVNSKGYIIAAEYGNRKIVIYNENFKNIEYFDSQCSTPTGVTIDKDDFIYISNRNKHTIQKFTANGQSIALVGTKGNQKCQFNQPVGLGYNTTNNKIYVSEEFNNRIQVLCTDLKFHCFISISGLNKPAGISFDPIGNIYIANFGAHNVIQCDSNGKLLRIFGMYGTGPGQLNHPLGITVSNSHIVYVTETMGHRISIFKTDGEFIGTFGEGQLKGPAGIACDNDGHTIVTDRRSIQVYNIFH